MSNEYKDWLADIIQDVVLDRGLADIVEWPEGNFVNGLKDGCPVRFEVWFDDELGEWRTERRELNI